MAIQQRRGAGGVIEQLERRTLLAAAIKPDIAFGNDGFVQVTNPDDPDPDVTELLAAEPNNKFVAETAFFQENHSGWAIGRFNSDGTPDTTFGTNGVYATDQDDESFSAAIQPDGKFVTGIDLSDTETDPKADTIQLTRITADGKLDTTFGTGGNIQATVALQSAFDSIDEIFPSQIAVAPNGKIIVNVSVDGTIAGTSFENGIALLQFNADGTPDTTFGNNGQTLLKLSDDAIETNIAIDSSNRILESDNSGLLRRFTTAGALDPSFGTNGGVPLNFISNPFPRSIAVQSDGDILVGGRGYDPAIKQSAYVATLNRFLPDGTLDTSFGDGGLVEIRAAKPNSGSIGQILPDQPTGKILISDDAGEIIRLNSDGSFDSTFNTNGIVAISSDNDPLVHAIGGPIAVDTHGDVLTSLKSITLLSPRPQVALSKSGTLYIEGESSDDTLVLTKHGLKAVLDLEGSMGSFETAKITAVNISADQGGNDTLSVGLDVPTTITGGDGADSITVSDGKDSINSGDGDDTIAAGNGQDTIYVGNGNDDVTVGYGQIYVNGGTGNDVYTLGSGGKTLYDSGGNNIITSSGGSTKFVLADGNDIVTTMSAHAPQRIGTYGGNDQITTSGSNDDIQTGDGDDTVSTSAGNDTINGGPGDDLLVGGSGDDSIIGGGGRDTIKGGAGNDTLQGLEDFSSEPARVALYGGEGNDTLIGTPGPDTLFGQNGDDVLTGNNGNDRIVGGPGVDQFFGGKGNDSIDSADGNAETVDGGLGNDVSVASDLSDHLVSIKSF